MKFVFAPAPAAVDLVVFSHEKAPVGEAYSLAFYDYIRYLDKERAEIRHKKKARLVVHCRSPNGRRRKTDLRALSCWAVDCDAAGAKRPSEFLDALDAAGASFVYQERRGPTGVKYHLVVPLSSAVEWSEGEDPWRSLSGRLALLRKELERVTGQAHDPALDRAFQGMKPYTIRPEDPPGYEVYQRHGAGGLGLDLEATAAALGWRPEALLSGAGAVRPVYGGVDEAALAAFKHLVLAPAPAAKGGWWIRCPFEHRHTEGAGTTRTWLTPDGRVVCLGAHCRGMSQADYQRALTGLAREGLDAARVAAARAVLESRSVRRVSVPEARDAMLEALDAVDPVRGDVGVVRVTTGAGKTHAAIEYLTEYTRPVANVGDGEDDGWTDAETSGKTAVLAVPTNALLRQVSADLAANGCGHKIRTGVLGTVDQSGAPLCKKADAARAIQNAGGNVHRALCARCEYRDGCPARLGVSRDVLGGGSLTLTNHALAPGVVKTLAKNGRYPLVVWDESPAWVSVSELSWADVNWLRDRLASDLERYGRSGRAGLEDVLADLAWSPLYPEPMTAVLLLFCDLLLRLARLGGTDLAETARVWGATPANRARVRSLRARFGLPVLGPAESLSLEELSTLADGLSAVGDGGADAVGAAFDELSGTGRADLSRGWTLGTSVLRAFASVGSGGALVRVGGRAGEVRDGKDGGGGLVAAGRTPAASALKKWGGLVMDATADTETVAAAVCRPPALTDIAVRDAPNVSRLWLPWNGLSRTGLGLRDGPDGPDAVWRRRWATIADDIRARLLAGTVREPRVVVFTYKYIVDAGAKVVLPPSMSLKVDLAWYGNARGYNHWYEAGYTHYITVGDPLPNLGAMEMARQALGLEVSDRRAARLAEQELAQAHGRARDVQPGGVRIHWHYGIVAPLGWDAGNAVAGGG